MESITFGEEHKIADDGLVHDGKITVTLGGDAFKGNPQYAIVVDGKEVSRGEVDWAKVTDGGQGTSGGDVAWQDVSVDYDFSNGMPGQIEVKFLSDAWGGPGSGEDRNLIVDKIQVDGLPIESEGEFTKYDKAHGQDIDGREVMAWKGDLEFNVQDAYESHLKDHNKEDGERRVGTVDNNSENEPEIPEAEVATTSPNAEVEVNVPETPVSTEVEPEKTETAAPTESVSTDTAVASEEETSLPEESVPVPVEKEVENVGLSTFTVENKGGGSGYNPGYENSYGYYTLDDEGNPTEGQIIWADVDDNIGETFSMDGLDPEKVGFFFVPNGENLNSGLRMAKRFLLKRMQWELGSSL